MPLEALEAGHPLDASRRSPSTSTPLEASPHAHQRRGLRRPHAGAPLRDGRRRPPSGPRPPTRSRHAATRGRGARRGRRRVRHLEAPIARRAPTASPCRAGWPSSTRSSRIAGALGKRGRGIVQVDLGARAVRRRVRGARRRRSAGRSRGPRSWPPAVRPGNAPDVVGARRRLGGEVCPQVACRPLVMQLTLADPFPFANVPTFDEVLALPHAERAARYADRRWRARAEPECEQLGRRSLGEGAASPETERLRGVGRRPRSPRWRSRAAAPPFDAAGRPRARRGPRRRASASCSNDDEERGRPSC